MPSSSATVALIASLIAGNGFAKLIVTPAMSSVRLAVTLKVVDWFVTTACPNKEAWTFHSKSPPVPIP